jgi:class 3 adenylate cyclase
MAEESRYGLLGLVRSLLNLTRWVLVLGLGGLGTIFAAEFIIENLFRGSALKQSFIIRLVLSICAPVVEKMKPVDLRGINFMPLIVAGLFYFVVNFVSGRLLQLIVLVDEEDKIRRMRARRFAEKQVEGLTFSSTSTDKVRRSFWRRLIPRKEEERDRLVRDYTELKKRLEKSKKSLAFLSVDIVGSTRIKAGQDPLLAEMLFKQYRHLLEEIFKKFRDLGASWTPDGVMVCFKEVNQGCEAGKDLLRRLPDFNHKNNPLGFPIQVRCGLNAGEVPYDENTPLELLSDRVLDITGHLQKAARPDTLLITEEIHKRLRPDIKKGFCATDKEVDGYKLFEWALAGENPVSRSTLTEVSK